MTAPQPAHKPEADEWIDVFRDLMPDDGDEEIATTWHARRDLAECDARLLASSDGEAPYVQLGSVRRADVSAIDPHDGDMTIPDTSTIDFVALERVHGKLVAEEVRALEALREADIDLGVQLAARDGLIARAVERDREATISTAEMLATLDDVLERAGWSVEQREAALIDFELRSVTHGA